MNLLITLLKAAHCRSTHHHFALDALAYLTSRRGKLLGNVLLKHYDQYLLGAKDPDTRFRDFRNHVLHVSDNDWGGAPAAAEKWYRQLIVQLDRERWSEAAYAAGVLSHYFTDPLMPLHTAQSEVEAIVHRPIEWSINQSYRRILKRFHLGETQVVFELASDPGWLSHAIKRAARVAYRHYAPLIRGYDLAVGTRRPQDGFDEASIDILAGLFGLSIVGWAAVLERAANNTRSKIPAMNLTLTTVVASIKVPSAWVTRKIESAAEQQAVRAIFEEFQATGNVVIHRPPEVVSVGSEREKDRDLASEPATPTPETEATATLAASSTLASTAAVATRGTRLSPSSPLVDAPSIGPKTAKRFSAIGLLTVEQFLQQTPKTLAESLKTSWIDAVTIEQWQDQARLVCEVPNLSGYKAQLLVGVGCRTTQELGRQSPAELHDRIVQFAATPAGSRILRSSRTPQVDEVAGWIHDAASTSLRRTA